MARSRRWAWAAALVLGLLDFVFLDRWQQPEFWKSITTHSEFETNVFGRVAIAIKRR